MLFLRDIDADVQLRCRACGHGGVLPRAMLERRFGPNYPVLSIAPHYRCSRCDSRDIESRPILAAPPVDTPSASNDEPSFDAPLAALNGLLASLRGGSGPERTADAEPPAPPPPAPVPDRGKPLSERPLSDLVADGPGDEGAAPLWEPVSLADMAVRLVRAAPAEEWDDEWDDEPPAGDASANHARAAANDAWIEPGREDSPEDGSPDEGEAQDGDDETLMAMRRLLAQAYDSDDDEDDGGGQADRHAGRAAGVAQRRSDIPADDEPGSGWDDQDEEEPPAFSHKALVRRDFEDDWGDPASDPWRADAGNGDRDDDFDDREPDGVEPSEDEILSFAIRDPEKPAFRPVVKPVPPAAAEPLDFDQHRAERRAQRPPPPPEDEEGYDRTLAALRSMIEDAANEPEEEEEDAPSPPRSGGRNAGQSSAKSADRPARREVEDDPTPGPISGPNSGREEDDWSLPAGWDDPDPEPDPAPVGRRSAQEREIEEAMKALRGLIEDEVQPASPTKAPVPPPVPPSSKPRTGGKPRQPVRGGPAMPEAAPPDARPDDIASGKPAGEPTPLSKTIAALRGMLELDGRRKR
ncbi:hypothetical protein EI613_22915 [Azospirillum sp. 412522]|nr:hypothetical protein [Azospirillum sp. 412522]MBY6264748.1 hypothetical protein [Azospirillum sp. 412522]